MPCKLKEEQMQQLAELLTESHQKKQKRERG